jgi:FKBP-type peptidyl-prolyl cis-trans isomerase FkpA
MKKAWIIALALLLGCSTDNVLSYEDQLKKDTATIDKYLEKNGITNVTTDISGLRLVVHQAGSGLFPVPTSKLTVKYVGTLLNGSVFDESNLNSSGLPQPFQTPLSGLIEGWQIAFYKYIAKGGKATLYIPSGLAYGRNEVGGVPPNSNLIFEIELIGFTN